MIGCGIDIGSRTTKLVLYDSDKKKLLASALTDSQLDKESHIRQLFNQALKKSKCKSNQVHKTVTTGYGREHVSFGDETITEITCHAMGVHHLVPQTRTIIEIGGQDSKLSRLDNNGKVYDFAMNDRCAAGTGRFLEAVARLLKVDIRNLGKLAKQSKKPANISSMCVVFAESEIIGLLSRKVSRSDIVAGIQKALATRVISLTGRKLVEPVVFTGGVALIPGMAAALIKECGYKITVAPQPLLTGALGAAILATET
jgi:(R)-2-hydroxyacyl-CoA dehydratese activating ATPase